MIEASTISSSVPASAKSSVTSVSSSPMAAIIHPNALGGSYSQPNSPLTPSTPQSGFSGSSHNSHSSANPAVPAPNRTNFASRPLIVTPKSIPDFMIPDLNSTKVLASSGTGSNTSSGIASTSNNVPSTYNQQQHHRHHHHHNYSVASPSSASPNSTHHHHHPSGPDSSSSSHLLRTAHFSPTQVRRHSSFAATPSHCLSQPGELNVEYYPLTHLPNTADNSSTHHTTPSSAAELNRSTSGGSGDVHLKSASSPPQHHSHHQQQSSPHGEHTPSSGSGGVAAGGAGLLKVKELTHLYVRRHSWDSRKTTGGSAQPKTMPNIKICVSQPGPPSRDSSTAGSQRGSRAGSIVDVIIPGASNSNSNLSSSAGGHHDSSSRSHDRTSTSGDKSSGGKDHGLNSGKMGKHGGGGGGDGSVPGSPAGCWGASPGGGSSNRLSAACNNGVRESRRMSTTVSNYFEAACRNKRSMRRRRKSTATARALSSVDLTSCSSTSYYCTCSPSTGTDEAGLGANLTLQLNGGYSPSRKNSMFDSCHVGKTLSSLLSPFRGGGVGPSGSHMGMMGAGSHGNMLAASHQFCSLQKLSSGSSSQCCSACSSRRSSFNPPSPELGFVEVDAIWHKDSMKLTVHVLNGWDIDAPFQGKLLPSDSLQVKLSLKGGSKQLQRQKQESTTFTNTKDPSFQQNFFFYAITEELLSSVSVKIKFIAKATALRRKRTLSHCELKLDSLEHNKTTKFWLALEEQTIMKTIGTLNFALRFTRDGTLQLSNINAHDLPKKLLKTSSDTYLTITFDDKEKQQSRQSSTLSGLGSSGGVGGGTSGGGVGSGCNSVMGPMVHKTSLVHNTLEPVFQESYNFKFSPRNVHDCTLEISLYQKCKLRSDQLVGQVRLGLNSTEVSEFEHWTSVISNPGVTQQQTHFLMEPEV
ncbi:uncharacterized protein LOC142339084 isoform X2 [Convolutriloba macropyga]|uniref:uncharacterized protein LOC142339084 isoform X2 n=1 Tax=Convolutriloba macropyga TaxID=536237 RepID=UPI003F51CBA1